MQGNIIVQPRNIRSKGESFNLSIRAKPVTPPIRKLQQLELENSNLGEINLVGNRITRSSPQRDKILITCGVYFSMNLEVKPLNTKKRENSNIENATSISCGIRFR
jgi:hypothetical protein